MRSDLQQSDKAQSLVIPVSNNSPTDAESIELPNFTVFCRSYFGCFLTPSKPCCGTKPENVKQTCQESKQ